MLYILLIQINNKVVRELGTVFDNSAFKKKKKENQFGVLMVELLRN